MIRRFVHDDAGYLAWLKAHPAGFVLNTYPHVTSAYLVLHRVACGTINRQTCRRAHLDGLVRQDLRRRPDGDRAVGDRADRQAGQTLWPLPARRGWGSCHRDDEAGRRLRPWASRAPD